MLIDVSLPSRCGSSSPKLWRQCVVMRVHHVAKQHLYRNCGLSQSSGPEVQPRNTQVLFDGFTDNKSKYASIFYEFRSIFHLTSTASRWNTTLSYTPIFCMFSWPCMVKWLVIPPTYSSVKHKDTAARWGNGIFWLNNSTSCSLPWIWRSSTATSVPVPRNL